MSFGPIGYGALYGTAGFSFGLLSGCLLSQNKQATAHKVEARFRLSEREQDWLISDERHGQRPCQRRKADKIATRSQAESPQLYEELPKESPKKTIHVAGNFFTELGTGVMSLSCGIYGTVKGCNYGSSQLKIESLKIDPASWSESPAFADCSFFIALAGLVTIAFGATLHLIAARRR